MGEVARRGGRGRNGARGGIAVPVDPASGAASAEPVEVRGVDLDAQTRCRHWHSPLDIVAIRMACCGEFYACADCHAALADHPLEPWPAEAFDSPAVRCGACGGVISIAAYMASGDRCPTCAAAFNPGCRGHYPIYFACADIPAAKSA